MVELSVLTEPLRVIRKQCRILYSTQSGRSKACARRFARILKDTFAVDDWRSSFDEDPWLQDLESFADQVRATNSTLFLFVSTTGDGEHTDTIQKTWKRLLQKSLPKDILRGISFYIFCLGDRCYGPQKFCAAGRKISVRFQQLGAKLNLEPGFGDDGTPNGGVFFDLDQWISLVVGDLPRHGFAASGISATDTREPTAPYEVKLSGSPRDGTDEEWQEDTFKAAYGAFFDAVRPVITYTYEHGRLVENGSTLPLVGLVEQNTRMTRVDWEQDTRFLRIHVKCSAVSMNADSTWRIDDLPYRAGDVAIILPSNARSSVDAFLRVLPARLREIADHEIHIHSLSESGGSFPGTGFSHWPEKFTLRGWLTYCADIQALPEREDLRALALFCSDGHSSGESQREKLVALSESSNSGLYADYVLREKRSWIDVLYDFDSLRAVDSKLTLPTLLGLIPPIRPREFSIASSPSQNWTDGQAGGISVDLCVAVVQGTTRLGRSYRGFCSSYLRDCKSGQSVVRFWIRPGSFHSLPLDGKPIMCIGAGTGVAPLRSLIHELDAVRRVLDSTPASSTLLFGFRKTDADFYFGSEWETLQETSGLVLLLARSRESSTKKKEYVQHILESSCHQGKWSVRSFLEGQSGSIFVAGNPKMARAVQDTLSSLIAEELRLDENEARKYLNRLQKKGRYRVEAWG